MMSGFVVEVRFGSCIVYHHEGRCFLHILEEREVTATFRPAFSRPVMVRPDNSLDLSWEVAQVSPAS